MSLLKKVPAAKLQLIALILLAVYPIAVLAARLDIWHFRNSFLLFIVAAVVGFIVLVLSVLKMSQGDREDSKALVIAVLVTLVPILVLGSSVLKAKNAPFIHDISTDTVNPPELVAAAADRTAEDHPVAYEGSELAKLQMAGYPGLAALEVNQLPSLVFESALQQVTQAGWQVLAKNNETLPFTIEAVDTSLLFGFKDDVVIRISSHKEAGSLVDVRSMSRQGKSDLGVNAKRIQALLDQI